MLYRHGEIELETVSIIQQNRKQDIEVCRRVGISVEEKYLVWIVHDHELSKMILSTFENRGEEIRSTLEKYELFFVQNQDCIFCFKQKEERNLFAYLPVEITTKQEQERLGVQIVEACMSTSIPMPVLYCILEQRVLNLAKDKSVYWGMQVNLESLNEKFLEKQCVEMCMQLLLDMQATYKNKNKILVQMLEKRLVNKDYNQFQELYRDVQIAAEIKNKKDWKHQGEKFLLKYKDKLFRALIILGIITSIVGIVALISILLFGDIPLLRLFTNDFRIIGTVILGS